MNRVWEIIEHLQSGSLSKAKELIMEVLDKGDDQEKYDLAYELANLGFLEEAIDLYKNLLEKYPDESELLILLAELYVDLNREDEALLLLEQIVETDPNYLQSLLLQADLYQVEGLFEVSEEKLQEAEKIAPNEEVVIFAHAELLSSIGKFAEAVYKYEQVLKKTESIAGVSIHERLAEVYSAAGEFEKSLKHYEIALDKKFDINVLFGFGLTAYQASLYELAIQRLSEVKELDPDYTSVYLPLAMSYNHIHDYEKAYETAKEGIEVNPYQKELFQLAGRLAVTLGKDEEAEEHLKHAIRLDPHYVQAILTLNKLYLRDGRFDEVVELLEPLVRDGEEDPHILWDYAVSAQEEEKYSDALNAYRKAYSYLKNNEEFLQNFGFFLLEEGFFDEAIEVFKQLRNFDPTNPEYMDIIERLETSLG